MRSEDYLEVIAVGRYRDYHGFCCLFRLAKIVLAEMLRRGVGVAAVRKKQENVKQYTEAADQFSEAKMAHINSQLSLFRINLQEFAQRYKHDIKRDPEFRKHFQIMCARIGVDPLASNKGFWSEMLSFGEFYYEVAVQIIEVCIITRPKNGGLIAMTDLLRFLHIKRGHKHQRISIDDIRRAINKVRILGEGFRLIGMEDNTMILTVPTELSSDHLAMLEIAQTTGGMINMSLIRKELNWDEKRSMIALTLLQREGMTWIDEQTSEHSYYFPGIALSGAYN
uniref:Vacuolar sorting protein SNF8 putative n=1 Tax=Albugo laibachii Nc14 TaxID=890382 RepID=F0WD36_9STRA|nr:vacuolar sorting protein SNF8 putative [Albugo laibachii Nc14]|eukprot:CCA19108.1 vacuolar sorting protein SNF8 putative [Albugo laibachii Nc14]